MRYLLSVDGGGTKTEFCISDLQTKKMKTHITGATNFKSVGIKEAKNNMSLGFQWMTEELGIRTEDIAYGVFGISGCDSENDYKTINEEVLSDQVPEDRRYLCNDGVLGFYAQTEGAGLVIIAGTGSIVIGIDRQGNIQRSGGWGYNFSDIGSGYWLGCEVLKETLLYCDGCLEYSPLYDKIRSHFGAASFKELPYIITGLQDYYEIAGIARLVAEMAEDGQEDALRILVKGADALADLAKSVYRSCAFKESEKISIVFSGGVLKGRKYEEILKASLKGKIPLDSAKFFVQKNTPVYGGIRLAKMMLEKGMV